ncbi:mechanosensitive ion channel family protein [Hathewaya limosa]|uniref:MscS family membrane protein n=1 Tax=Hathewaya limosa TaxID=1536 RepID=A0ABU0JTI2_HATLI|nr:mechanosensitive ion channel family protein [Hathewaya limosa]MDQ0480403.1 MscS family membrane protein [Hathewaya limosa]
MDSVSSIPLGVSIITRGLENFMDFFINNNYENIKRLIAAVIIFFVLLLFRRFLTNHVFTLFKKIINKVKPSTTIRFIPCFEQPFNMMFVVFGIYFALTILGKNYFINVSLITKIFRSILIMLITWGFYNLSEELAVLSDGMKERLGLNVDKILFPFISKCLRVILIALAITIILAEWNINIQMFVTGLGLGGLAFSLAAKDAASNVIAGFILIMDKPFNIGDWISTGSIEGIVEDLSFRSTKIRTFTQEIITVPNSSLANSAITNFTKRDKRKCNFVISIAYETSREKIEKCIYRIEEMIKGHEQICDEGIVIALQNLNDSGLDIGIYYFTKITDFKTFLKIKEEVNLNIMDILEEEGVDIPYPTNTVYLNDISKKEDVIENDSSLEDIG